MQGRVPTSRSPSTLRAECSDKKKLEENSSKAVENLALDGGGHLTYLKKGQFTNDSLAILMSG